MQRLAISIMTVPSMQGPGIQTIWVRMHVHEPGSEIKSFDLISHGVLRLQDGGNISATAFAIEVTDMIYQKLTELYADQQRRASVMEINARPSDTSTN